MNVRNLEARYPVAGEMPSFLNSPHHFVTSFTDHCIIQHPNQTTTLKHVSYAHFKDAANATVVEANAGMLKLQRS